MKWVTVLKREYIEKARQKSFIIGTLVAPILLVALYSIPILSVVFVPNEQITLAVLDRTGRIGEDFVASLDDTLKNGKIKYVTTLHNATGTEADALKEELITDIKEERLDVVIEIPAEVLDESRVNYISKDVMNEIVTDRLRSAINPFVISARFADLGVESADIERLTRRVRMNENKITRSGVLEEKAVAGEFVLAVAFVMMLYIMLISWGIVIMKSIIEEKSSRVIEVLLSSLEPRDLFIGKIVGLGALGFTQVAIWMSLLLGAAVSLAVVAAQFSGFISVTPIDVIYFVLFFVLGFLFYASMFSIIGAMCSTDQDAQQLQMFAMSPLIVAVMLMFLVMQNPNSTVAAVISLIPPFTPMIMLTRVLVAEPPMWQVILGIVLLGASIYGVIWVSARVYRVGVLMHGKRPTLREVVRWARYA
jgi:ABC-2 type transport system permease protein